MKSLTIIITCIILHLLSIQYVATKRIKRQIQWNGNIGYGCDFQTSSYTALGSRRGERCLEDCILLPRCTHFTWSTLDGGTCFLKEGPISRLDAFLSNDNQMMCGIKRLEPVQAFHRIDTQQDIPTNQFQQKIMWQTDVDQKDDI